MRAALAVMAGLLCALAGFRRAGFLRDEAKRLDCWSSVLERLTLLLSEGGLSLPDALRSAACSASAADKLLVAISEDMKRTPLKSAAEAFVDRAARCTEYDILLHLMERLGHGSLDSRRLAVEQASAQIRQMSRHAADVSGRDAKLFQTLGLAGGAALTILLL